MRDRPRRGGATARRKLGLTALLLAASAVSLLVRPQHHTARAQEVDPALLDRIIASLTVDERVGQLVMVNFVGDDVSAQSDIAGLVQSFRVGSVLVTASNGNIVNRDDTAAQLVRLTNGLQQRSFEASRRSGADGEYFLPL